MKLYDDFIKQYTYNMTIIQNFWTESRPKLNVPQSRRGRLQMFFKIGIFKNFAIFTGKHLCWSLFLIKAFRPVILLKRDSNTGIFLRIIRNFKKELFFYITPPVAASESYKFKDITWTIYIRSKLGFVSIGT